MKKEIFEQIKREMQYVGILFLIFLVIFKIAFFKENLIVLLRTALSLFWLFVLPGYFAMLYWHDRLEFMERLVVGIGLSAALTGVFSYYIGLMGLNIKYHGILLPMLIIAAGFAEAPRKKN